MEWLMGVLRLTRNRLQIIRNYYGDFRHYASFSAPPDGAYRTLEDPRHIECQLTKDYHRVEKGLALKFPKSPFGSEVERRLSYFVQNGDTRAQDLHRDYASDALGALQDWNSVGTRKSKVVIDAAELPKLTLSPEAVSAFFKSRRSVRDFDLSKGIDIDLLMEATELAINTPSVCNRQAWRVHYFTGERVGEVLSHQNGNRGFREQVPCVAVVTVDSRLFSGPGERNQAWIDGGLFSMSLVLALHGLGLSTCMLNWSMPNSATASLRKEIALEDWQHVIMMIAIGHASLDYRVARSPRRPLDEIVTFN